MKARLVRSDLKSLFRHFERLVKLCLKLKYCQLQMKRVEKCEIFATLYSEKDIILISEIQLKIHLNIS